MNLKLLILFVLLVVMIFSCKSSPQANIEIINENKTTPTPSPSATLKLDYETNAKLQLQTNSLLKLFGNMPKVPVYIKDEPIIKTGSETQKGVAYTTCENKKDPTIFVKKVFYLKTNDKQLTNSLKHELVHAWFCRQGEIIGHNERFRQKFKEIGGFGN